MKKIFVRIFLTMVSFLFLLAPSKIFAAGDKLEGDAFGNADYIVSMDDGWLKRGINYDATAQNADLVVNIDQSETPLLVPIIEKYAQDHNLNIIVISGTCGVSNRNLLNKSIDIGSFCCPPGDDDRFPGLQFHTLGITPLALIVHAENLIEDISFAEAQKIFMGEIQRWSVLQNAKSVKNVPAIIQPVTFIHCKNRPGHWRLLLDDEELFSVGIRNVTDIPAMIYQVGNDKNTIGYETVWLAKDYYKKQGTVKLLKLGGMSPENTEYLLHNKYPLYRVYNVTTWTEKASRKPEAEKLVAYLKEYIAENGSKYSIVPASRLRQEGWKFRGDELVAAPE